MRFIDDIPVWGDPQENAVLQMKNCAGEAESCALMADHHLGYAVPIGGVIAYQGRVSPSGVGFDIACGNKAVRLDCDHGDVRKNIPSIMDEIWKSLSFGVGRVNRESVDHDLFDDDPAWKIPAAERLKPVARKQLGTIGGGNHYVDLFSDERERIWAGVHFGSRGLGHKLATHFIKAGGGKNGMHVDPVLLDVETELGAEYVACMKLAGRYAYAGRDWVCGKVASILGAEIREEVHNHHNFAWEEEHDGRRLWVVRKGATPAFPGQKGFVGGSMGDRSVILEGVDSERERAGPLLHRPRRRSGHVPDPCRRQDPIQEGEAGPHLGGGNQPGHDVELGPRHGSGAPRGRHRRISPLLQTAARGPGTRTGAPSGSCTRSTPSAWPWPPRASSIPTGIEAAASSGTPQCRTFRWNFPTLYSSIWAAIAYAPSRSGEFRDSASDDVLH